MLFSPVFLQHLLLPRRIVETAFWTWQHPFLPLESPQQSPVDTQWQFSTPKINHSTESTTRYMERSRMKASSHLQSESTGPERNVNVSKIPSCSFIVPDCLSSYYCLAVC